MVKVLLILRQSQPRSAEVGAGAEHGKKSKDWIRQIRTIKGKNYKKILGSTIQHSTI